MASSWVVVSREVIITGLDPRDRLSSFQAASSWKLLAPPLIPVAFPRVVGW